MYKFPADFDSGQFVGLSLEMVCFNANQIYLHFGNRTSICAEQRFEVHYGCGDDEAILVDVPSHQSSLMRLLENAVGAAWVENGDTLKLEFDNGSSLCFSPGDQKYEAFHVLIGGIVYRI